MKLGFIAGLILTSASSFAQEYTISTVAGGAPPPTPLAATSASLGLPGAAAVDSSGNVYFSALACIFKLDKSGVLTRVAGTAQQGYSGDGGPATSAQLYYASGIAVDGGGNIYFADTAVARVRKISANGIITTIAGTGVGGAGGDGGPAVNAAVDGYGVAVDSVGNIYISGGSRIRKISASGIITTIAGNGTLGYSGDGGPAINAQLTSALGMAVDSTDAIYFVDNSKVRKITPNGLINVVAAGDLVQAVGVATDAAGNLYIADRGEEMIRKVSPGGVITILAGDGMAAYSGDGGPANSSQLSNPSGVAVDSTGTIYIADTGNGRIRRIAADGTITTVAGSGIQGYSGDGGPALKAQIYASGDMAIDGAGNIYFPDPANNRVRKFIIGGIITTVAGNGTPGYSGDGGPAASAQLHEPTSVAVDAANNLYISDTVNGRIRKVSPNGIISTVAQTGGGFDIALDGAGNIYMSDWSARVQKISPSGSVTTVAGNGTPGFSGDGGLAVNAQLNSPRGIAVDGAGNLYIADFGNGRVRKVSHNGIVTTLAAINAFGGTLPYPPSGIAVDASGNAYVACTGSLYRISSSGDTARVAGNGSFVYSGDRGLATNAFIGMDTTVTVDVYGNLYIDQANDGADGAIRILKPVVQSVAISAVLDAASESAVPLSPGKVVAIYGYGMGSAALIQNEPADGAFGTQAGGTAVSFNGIPAPVLYATATQVGAIVPYGIAGSTTAQVTVSYQGQVSSAASVAVAPSAPSFFSANATGAGQIAAVNLDGSLNDAAHPVAVGDYISLYATGEGQTSPPGVDGKLATAPYPKPLLFVQLTIGGVAATPYVAYAGAAPTEVAGLMQIVVQIPPGVSPGGYVPVVLTVGNGSTVAGATWIAVSAH